MAEVVVSWRDYGCFGPPGPWSEETYQNERSAGEALLAKEWTRSRAYYVNGKAVSHAQVVAAVAHYEKREADAERQAQRHAAEAAALAAARRMAVVEVLTCQRQGIWLDRVNRVPDIEWARGLLARDDMRDLLAAMTEDADALIAAYEGARV